MPTNTAGEVPELPQPTWFIASGHALKSRREAKQYMMAFSSDARAAIQPDEVYTADQMRAYAQEAVRAALASKPDARMHAREAAESIRPDGLDVPLSTRYRREYVDRQMANVRAMLASSPQSPPVVEAPSVREALRSVLDMVASGIPDLETVIAARAALSTHPSPDTLCSRLQQRCSKWGVYWRSSDAHGVDLTLEQAHELLRDALGVEVEIAAVEKQPQVHPVALRGEASGAVSEAPSDALAAIEEIGRRIDAGIAQLRDGDVGDQDPELLEEARRTLNALDARRWRWARDNLLSMSFQSGPHKSSAESHSPIGDANTSAYWDRVADAAISQSTTIAEWKT
jgi:hypothetical protein